MPQVTHMLHGYGATYNAAAFTRIGETIEAGITKAVAAALADGIGAVWIPQRDDAGRSMLPYNASLVTFNPAVKMIREGGSPAQYDVRAYGAKGDGVADDRAAIVAAQAAAQGANGAAVFFPVGTYAVSDYIDLGPSTVWIGDGLGDVAGIGNVTLKAIGTNLGIVRSRPGTIGSVNPVQRELHFLGLGFAGSATTGHLVTIARNSLVRFTACYFNGTSGQGLKDDQTTLTGAAGVYLFGTNIVSFINCNFENNLAATNGAGITMETGVNITSFYSCNFNNNTLHHRMINANTMMEFHSCNFNAGAIAHKADNGGQACLTSYNGWYEMQTAAADPSGIIFQLAGNAKNEEIVFQGCRLNGPLAADRVMFQSAWIVSFVSRCNQIFNASICYSFGNVPSFTQRNREESNTYTAVTQLFNADNFTPSSSGFITSDSGLQTITDHTSVTLTDAATILVDAGLGDIHQVTLTASGHTIGFPSNPRKNQRLTFIIIQDGTGGRTLLWHVNYKTAWSDTGNTLNKRSTISYVYDGTNYIQDGAQSPYI